MVDHDLRALDAIVEAYEQDQRRIRGLRETTPQSYERVIRSFLRMKGYCDEKLELSVPTVARWELASLPRCLDEQQLKQVLEGFDRTGSA